MSIAVGDVRPSQLLWTYGPGALIDLPNLSVITMGLNKWDMNRCLPIGESRLLEAVRRILGPQVAQLRKPPMVEEDTNPFAPENRIGVPVRPFPRWLRCVRCGLLAEFDSGLFTLKDSPFRPDQIHFVHTNCEKGSRSDAVPARFLLACRNGHLDDFPWHWFVHLGTSTCRGTLRFFERGASLQTENLWVKCDGCGSARSLVHAFGEEAHASLPACRGRHPHLDRYEEGCEEEARTVLLGATNGWFPVTVTVLAIPPLGDPLSRVLDIGWNYLEGAKSVDHVEIIRGTLIKTGLVPGIERFDPEELWKAIETRRKGGIPDPGPTEEDVKRPEWVVLTHPSPPTDWPHFLSERTPPPERYRKWIREVLLLKRLREVNALVGYTRVEAPEETVDPAQRPKMADLTKGRPEWVPANEVHGEGIFLFLDESEIISWERRPSVMTRDGKLMAGHRGWRNARRLDPQAGYPGIRYTLLHTFAHLLIRELSLECGYNAASIRERIYSSQDSNSPMSGLLLYTAAADSDGTLGGLVELGRADNLERLIDRALERAAICSSDPLCSEHDPGVDRSLHLAACHACTFVAETSCERQNRYLDRALLVGTFESIDTAFFKKDDASNE